MNNHHLVGKRIVAYVRVSSDKQDGTRQEKNIQEWATRSACEILQWFRDTSGHNPRDLSFKREAFQRLLKEASSGGFDAVVVDSLDRFGVKDSYELGHYIHQLRDCGVELWSVTQGNLSSVDAATVLISTVGAITSREEQLEKAHRSLGGKMLAAFRGQYVGGYPPYGLDCVCVGSDGTEKWRLIWTGHYRRVKLMPDGSEEIYEGKDNSPSKDRNDELRYRPSIKTERLETVRRIFEWYTEESISPSQIAARLNQMQVDPVFGKAWNKQKIKQLLKHPIYVGLPTCNKRGNGRHKEFVNGQESIVPQVRGRTKTGRHREPSDWWQPTRIEFEPIVEPVIFELAQRKMQESAELHRNPNRKPPRTASFWLRGFIRCAHCGLPMRAWNTPKYRSYFCANYGTYGSTNPTGCRSNRVKAELVEKMVELFLEEIGKKAEMFLATADGLRIRNPKLIEANKRFRQAFRRLKEFVADSLPEGETEIEVYAATLDGDRVIPSPPVVVVKKGDEIEILDDGFSFFDLYRFVHERQRRDVKQQLSEKEAEFSRLFSQFKRLTNSRAIDQANQEMGELDVQIMNLKSQLEPLDLTTKDAFQEVQRLAVASKQAQTALSDSNFRRRAEALRGVVDRIVCHFKVNDTKASNQPKSLLESVEILPLIGQPLICYPNGITVATG